MSKQQIFFLDFETTGLNPYYNDIIELAIKQYDVKEAYTTLIMPSIDVSKPREGGISNIVPSKITEITGITDKLLQEEGISTKEAILGLFKYLQSTCDTTKPIYLVAHNGTLFDFLFLKKYIRKYMDDFTVGYLRILENMKYIDSMLFARLFMGSERVNQPGLCRKYNVRNSAEHRALGDVKALEKIYKYMCQEYSNYKKQHKEYYLDNPDAIIEDCLV